MINVLFIPYFRLLVFGILVTFVAWFSFIFFRFATLALQNVNKDHVIFLYFCNFFAKENQEPKTKNGMKETWMKNVFYTLNNSGILPGFLSVKHSIVDSRKSPENLTSWFGSILMFSEFGLNIAMMSNCLLITPYSDTLYLIANIMIADNILLTLNSIDKARMKSQRSKCTFS